MQTGNRGLFIPGPTNIPNRLRQAMDLPLEDQRAPDFPSFTLRFMRKLHFAVHATTFQIRFFLYSLMEHTCQMKWTHPIQQVISMR